MMFCSADINQVHVLNMNQAQPTPAEAAPEPTLPQPHQEPRLDPSAQPHVHPNEGPNNIPMSHWIGPSDPLLSPPLLILRNQDENEGQDKHEQSEDKGTPGKDEDANEGSEDEADEEEKEAEEQENQKESSDSNREDNDTSQQQTNGGKKCFNKLCNSKKIFKKIRSKVQISRYRFLCKNCYDNYVNNSFCEFCEQIYSNYENEEDDTKWVGCDKCERWNHIECQRKYRHKNFEINKDKDTQYECLSCSKKNRNGQAAPQELPADNSKRKTVERGEYENSRTHRTKVQINKQERIPIFHKKPDIFPCLQSFLQTYNFRLCLNDSVIRDDLQSLRSLNRRPIGEEEGKKGKKMKPQY